MTSLVSWSEIGVGEEADAASDCTDLAVTSEAAPGASAIAEHVAAAPLGVNRCVRRDAGISTLDAAGTVMPSARGATGAGAAKTRVRTK